VKGLGEIRKIKVEMNREEKFATKCEVKKE